MKRLLKTFAASILLLGMASQATEVGLIKIQGAIGPATASYISRAIDLAKARNYQCVILQLNTPGGLVSSTEEIIQSFYAAKIPVVVYVSPTGASATSAGTFITMAADIAAMAPNTRIGAAHPVALGIGGGNESTNAVMATKAENDLASFIKSIAEKRGRNAEWAVSAVRESASITSEKALELNVVDLIAKDLPDLLHLIDGHEINGNTLKTSGAKITAIGMAAREKFFQMLWRPEVMFVLMLIAMYGIISELNNPGAIFPGVAGAIALILFLYMSTILPINIAGLALILLAIALFIIDVFATSHGVLTVGGVVSFFLGALMLFDRSEPVFRLSLSFIIPGTLLTAAFFLFIAGAGLRAQRLPVRVGKETLIGKISPAVKHIDAHDGKVFVEGEYWNARSEVPIEQGQLAEIVSIEGLILKVKPKT
jgi:membrane-bound serine protease (ClpP class)